MATKKIDVFQSFEDADMKHLQTVYLDKHGFEAEEISKWTGYAVSTIRGYIRKFASLVEKACATFYHIRRKLKLFCGAGVNSSTCTSFTMKMGS